MFFEAEIMTHPQIIATRRSSSIQRPSAGLRVLMTIAILTGCASGAHAAADSAPKVNPGSRIRVLKKGSRRGFWFYYFLGLVPDAGSSAIVGQLARVDETSIGIDQGRGGYHQIAWTETAKVQVAAGRKWRFLPALLAGAAVGYVSATFDHELCGLGQGCGGPDDRIHPAKGTAFGAATALAVLAIPATRWVDVPRTALPPTPMVELKPEAPALSVAPLLDAGRQSAGVRIRLAW